MFQEKRACNISEILLTLFYENIRRRRIQKLMKFVVNGNFRSEQEEEYVKEKRRFKNIVKGSTDLRPEG